MRHYFDKFGGNLGTSGCVSFMFASKGIVIVENNGIDEDTLMEDAFEFGADDLSVEEEAAEISCAPADLSALREGLSSKDTISCQQKLTAFLQPIQRLLMKNI